MRVSKVSKVMSQRLVLGWVVPAVLLGLVSCSGGADLKNTADTADTASAPGVASAGDQSTASSETSLTTSAASGQDLTVLLSRVWRMTQAPSEPAPGSIYVFLANGTFLQTSCVETYALSGWTVDKDTPNVLRVSENGQVALTAEILELTNTTLRLRQTLVRSGDTQEVTLSAMEDEFICPDLPR